MAAAPSSPGSRRGGGGCLAVIVIALAAFLLWFHGFETPLPEEARIDRLVVQKSARQLRAYAQGRLLKTYAVSLGPEPGPKRQEGDGRTPEGLYTIDWHNSASRYHRSLHVSYPSPADVRRAREAGHSPGGDIMIHGLPNGLDWLGRLQLARDWTAGCIAVTNPQIEELFRAVPDGTPIEIRP